MLSSFLKLSACPSTRLFTTSVARCAQPPNHTPDSYAKDVDTSAASSDVHVVDSSSAAARKPHDAPSNKFSKAGAEASYETTEGSSYQTQGGKEKNGEDLRYGGKPGKTGETSDEVDGPLGKAKGGRS